MYGAPSGHTFSSGGSTMGVIKSHGGMQVDEIWLEILIVLGKDGPVLLY